MIWQTASGLRPRRSWLWLLSLLVLVAQSSFALTALPFAPIREHVTNELTRLSELENPTRSDRVRSNAYARANNIFGNGSLNDGQALRKLKTILRRYPESQMPLDTTATNVVVLFVNEYQFVGVLLGELPPSSEATAVKTQYSRLTAAVTKLTAIVNAAKTSALHDAIKRRLDKIFSRANAALLVPFPSLLPTNTVAAVVNGNFFKTSAGAASGNVFQATETDTNIMVLLSAFDSQPGTNSPPLQRGLVLSVPNMQPGTIRYTIPDASSFTIRTDVDLFSGASNDYVATNGTIFVTTTPTEAYGSFVCSGPGFVVTSGVFRINLSRQP